MKLREMTPEQRKLLNKFIDTAEIVIFDKEKIRKQILKAYAIRDRGYKYLDKAMASVTTKEEKQYLTKCFHDFSNVEILLDNIIRELYGKEKRD